MMLRAAVPLVLLVAACTSSQKPPPGNDDIEATLLARGSLSRIDVDSPRGWYWLVGSFLDVFDSLGHAQHEASLTAQGWVVTRLYGMEGDALAGFDTEPQDLEWSEPGPALLMFEASRVSPLLAYGQAEWGLPSCRLSLSDDGTDVANVWLIQSGHLVSDHDRFFLRARRFVRNGRACVAYWGRQDDQREQEMTVIRLRVFDKGDPEWQLLMKEIHRCFTFGSEVRALTEEEGTRVATLVLADLGVEY